MSNTPVQSLNKQGDKVVGVELDSGLLTADEVIIAAGAGTSALLTTAGYSLPMRAPPGLLVVTRLRETLLNGLIMSPRLHVRQAGEGRLIAGADFGGTDPGENPDAAAAEVFAALKDLLVAGDSLELETYTIGYRPVPDDGFPAVGRIAGTDGLYVAVLHSGITLAPAIGRFIADEVLTGRREDLLAPYSPERFSDRLIEQ